MDRLRQRMTIQCKRFLILATRHRLEAADRSTLLEIPNAAPVPFLHSLLQRDFPDRFKQLEEICEKCREALPASIAIVDFEQRLYGWITAKTFERQCQRLDREGPSILLDGAVERSPTSL